MHISWQRKTKRKWPTSPDREGGEDSFTLHKETTKKKAKKKKRKIKRNMEQEKMYISTDQTQLKNLLALVQGEAPVLPQ